MDENAVLDRENEESADTISEIWAQEQDPPPRSEADQPGRGDEDIDGDGWDALEREGIGADQSFTIRYLGEDQTVSKKEIIALAQKGRDYDRIRSRADSLSEAVKSLAQRTGVTPDELIRRAAGNAPAAAHERREREVGEFMREYGTVDPLSIPAEVWEAVNRGTPLTEAYRRFENRALRREVEGVRRETENRMRSAGSRASSGALSARDAIEADWYGGR